MDSSRKHTLRRTACDRCRQQRLKCLRDQDKTCCHRCKRLGHLCAMAAMRRPGRPRKSESDGTRSAVSQNASSLPQPPDTAACAPHVDPALTIDETLLDGIDLLSTPTSDADSIGDTSLTLISTRNYPDFGGFDFGGFDDAGPSPESFPAASSKQPHSLLDMNYYLRELSELNVELHAQWGPVKAKCSDTSLGPYLCPDNSYMNGTGGTFAERAMTAFQKFHGLISNVESSLRQSLDQHADCGVANLENDLNSFTDAAGLFNSQTPTEEQQLEPPRLESALVLIIISCYVQLVNIFFDLSNRIHYHLMKLKQNEMIEPVDTIRFQVGSVTFWDGRLQSMIFCMVVINYLDRVERVLGLLPDHRYQAVPIKYALLDRPHYRELLDKQFESQGLAGCASPKKLRDLVDNLQRAFMADPSR